MSSDNVRNRKATVCDDNKDILYIAKSALLRLGYDVHDFSDPILALEHIERCKDCTLLVTDIKMPKMDGFQLSRRVRELRPDITVVAISAYEESAMEFEATSNARNIAGFLRKPFHSEELKAILQEIGVFKHTQ